VGVYFTVSTPTCTISVRGTEFTVSHHESPMKTSIEVVSGEVEVTPRLFSAPSVTLSAGEQITAYEDRFGGRGRLGDVDAPTSFDRALALPCAPDEEFVRSLYHCITHREPTAQELQEQVGRLRGGVLRQQMVTYFLLSPGYEDQNHDGARFMTDASQAIYAREPTAPAAISGGGPR